MEHVQRSGFGDVYLLIHLFIGGSELHGAKVGATDDLDLYGVFVGPPNDVLGLQPVKHFIWSTAADDRRNGPEDVDLTLYSLNKWAVMAARGNATALHLLFANATATSDPVWAMVQAKSRLFLSKRSAVQFLSFADNQLRRITGDKGEGTHGRRPEYECAHGYDSKAAMHCLRLYFECIELMREGKITLPRPEKDLLIGVRQGMWTLERFRMEAKRLRVEAEASADSSNLPEEASPAAISDLIATTHLTFWRDRSLV